MIPKTDSIADKIGQYLHKFGKCSREQIYLGMEGRGHQRDSVKKVVRDMEDGAQIIDVNGCYGLSELLQSHYSTMAPEAYKGEIVPARKASEFKPLKSLPWAQHLDKLREWDYKNGSTDLRNAVGYMA